MTKKVRVDATLNFGFEGHLLGHKGQFGSKIGSWHEDPTFVHCNYFHKPILR